MLRSIYFLNLCASIEFKQFKHSCLHREISYYSFCCPNFFFFARDLESFFLKKNIFRKGEYIICWTKLIYYNYLCQECSCSRCRARPWPRAARRRCRTWSRRGRPPPRTAAPSSSPSGTAHRSTRPRSPSPHGTPPPPPAEAPPCTRCTPANSKLLIRFNDQLRHACMKKHTWL